jgi:hypothetical protein
MKSTSKARFEAILSIFGALSRPPPAVDPVTALAANLRHCPIYVAASSDAKIESVWKLEFESAVWKELSSEIQP